MVCDREGNINIYSKELEYVRQIVGTFRSISSDEHGSLYACNEDNSCGNVYTNEGQFLHSFGCNEDGVKKLKGPRDVCVSIVSMCMCLTGMATIYLYSPHRVSM